ncbi:hypothetical protein FM113_07950 [Leucobacter sp. 7(1)]|uniref:hypothetical protein n=1 Tax=Leucobacter sp. 7(1) TaxID=1255613 RepID=UPI00097EE126|nr:hypothetical protein [Leucobacter sp. 7(1)]SJN10005.1 hypothetical protein FM113_07950 [Leucobacter sp. 7(1)]
MSHESPRQRAIRIAGIIGALVVIGVVLWIDIATGIWQDLVILAGLAAGLVSFLLTVLVVDRIVARSTARRWAPVTRLALTELLHDLADENQSEIARGHIVPRRLPTLDQSLSATEWSTEQYQLRALVVTERRILSEALSRWVEFLATSTDTGDVLRQVADIALQMDRIRDASLELDRTPKPAARDALDAEIASCNTHFATLSRELARQLAAQDQPARTRRSREPSLRS